MTEPSKPTWKSKVVAGLLIALWCPGTAKAQLRPNDQTANQGPHYAVEGVALGSKLKSDSAANREYKCAPSEQFDGFTWCQRSSRDSERRGSFEATYSILHSRDGAVVYANRSQQPAFLDAGKIDQDIQKYARAFGAPPKIVKLPHRSGMPDATLATWGTIELEPLDADSVKVLAEGKSPRKGFLIDFLGNFTRSAQEKLPIF